MARNNHVFVVGDITGDIYFDVFEQGGGTVQFLRLYMFVKPTEASRSLEGIRIVAYGSLAELVCDRPYPVTAGERTACG
jgi:hypothetical protein